MKVLWLINIPLPEASRIMNIEPSPFGGWLINASTYIAHKKEITLSIAFPKPGATEVITFEGDNKTYYAFPPINNKTRNAIKNSNSLMWILKKVKPDLVHIFGTEYAHTLAMVIACRENNINTVISIQGLVSICAKHYKASLPMSTLNSFTIRDLIKHDNLIQQQKKFIKRGRLEIEALQHIQHIIGRTTWDKACTSQINPNAKYHFCNETLRDVFYDHQWDLNYCEKHSIFLSQGSYPIKGLHYILEAMPSILKRFPDAKLYISGNNIIKSDNAIDILKRSSYGKYIKKLIRKLHLENEVVFIGVLNEEKMCERYLHSHVFVCPSSIENSSNSLGEAMLLGVPCIASYVGGVIDLLTHKEEGYVYQSDAPYMLAYYICEVFTDDKLALQFSKKAREHAMKTHNREINNHRLISIYQDIINEN